MVVSKRDVCIIGCWVVLELEMGGREASALKVVLSVVRGCGGKGPEMHDDAKVQMP